MLRELRARLIKILANGDTVILNANLELPKVDSVTEWIGFGNTTAIVLGNEFHLPDTPASQGEPQQDD